MAAPTQISGSPWTSAFNSSSSPKLAPTSGTFAVSVGDLIVVEAVNENDSALFANPPTNAAGTSPATITWTSQQEVNPDSHGSAWCGALAWTGTVTAAGNVQVSLARSGGGTAIYGIVVWAFNSHGGVGQTAKGNANSSAPSVAPASAWSANSAVCCAVGDWNAASFGGTRSYRTNLGTATEANYAAVDGNYTAATWYHADAGASPGSGAVGLTTPTMKWSLVAVEVLAPSGGSSPVTANRAVKYNVANSVLANRAVKYNALNAVIANRAVKFNVLNAVIADRAVKYNLAGVVVANRAVKYGVLGGVLANRVVKFSVQGSVIANRAVKYAVANSVLANRAVKYAVANSVLANRAVKFNVQNAVTASRAVSYKLAGFVVSTRRVRYNVGNATVRRVRMFLLMKAGKL